MHLIRSAHNEHCPALLVLLATLATAMLAQSPESATPTLDLTKPPTREEQGVSGSVGPRAPGSSIGGIGGVGQPPPYTLPLAVELLSISPQPIRMGEKFKVEILLKNTGDSAFLLPASRNAATVRKQGNKGRRTFLFSLTIDNPTAGGRPTSALMVSSDGANTIPDSFLRIEPGQSVRVLFTGDLYPLSHWYPIPDWLKPDLKQARVRAEVSEWKYEDKRYFIENEAKPVLSGNTIKVDLAPSISDRP